MAPSSHTREIPQESDDQQQQQQQQQQHTASEYEPLLGRPGDVTQDEGAGFYRNLYTGTAAVAQAGILILVALVWSGVLSHPLILFSPHPLLNSFALLLQVQAALILQPTSTSYQKRRGTRIHYSIQIVSILSFFSALVIIEVNKGPHPEHPRFSSPHAFAGLITYIAIVLQASVGVIQYFFPAQILGSVERGKKIYKYHRWSGYALLVLELGTVSAATQTPYNANVAKIPLAAVVGAAVLVVLGVGGRIKKQKLGL